MTNSAFMLLLSCSSSGWIIPAQAWIVPRANLLPNQKNLESRAGPSASASITASQQGLFPRACTGLAARIGSMPSSTVTMGTSVPDNESFSSYNSTDSRSYFSTMPRTTTTMSSPKRDFRPKPTYKYNNVYHPNENHASFHNYNSNVDTNQVMESYFANRQRRRFRVYCDLDGVLVDFCRGIQSLYHEEELQRLAWCTPSMSSTPAKPFSVDDLHRGSMWERVSQANSFFEHLPWMTTGQTLWQVVQELEPCILTGVPKFPQASRQQKVEWCRRELGIPIVAHTDMAGHNFQHEPVSSSLQVPPESSSTQSSMPQRLPRSWTSSSQQQQQPYVSKIFCHVITCWSHNKHCESGPGAVLIDDRLDLKASWEAKGGIFVHHNGCAENTITQLERHGVLDEYGYAR
ncbi:hypothetical protein ACA910_002892 [Epithemia clementina (nom. ined.)]